VRVLAFAAEAWETKLLLGVLRDPGTFGSAVARRLVLSDVTSFQYDSGFVSEIANDSAIEYDSLEKLFVSWQSTEQLPPESDEDLNSWTQRLSSRFDTDTLLASDIILTPWERSRWMLPITEAWRQKIAYDQVAFTERQFVEFQPDVILCVERRRLVGLAAQVVAEARGIPCLTLIFTRIGNRWMVRTDGGIGMSLFERRRFNSHRATRDVVSTAKVIAELTGEGMPLYDSLARTKHVFDAPSKMTLITRELGSAYQVALASLFRHLHPKGGKRAQSYSAVRYEQAFWSLTRSHLKQAIMRVLVAMGLDRVRWSQSIPREENVHHILWLLHTRPEDGVSSMGRGEDELQLILRLSNNLPKDLKVAAKEHPSMVGFRDPRFYQTLLSSGIHLVHPHANTAQLIRDASGVAGISGTALLEAVLAGKPVLTLGEPEFLVCMPFHSWADLDSFSAAVASGSLPASVRSNAVNYIAWVLDNSDSADLFWGDLDSDEGYAMICSVASRFMNLAKSMVSFPLPGREST
jgi:hypothetical protein